MRNNVLVIGVYVGEHVDSYDWWQQLPNISEYDTIILDTTSILRYLQNSGRLEHRKDNIYAMDDDESRIYKQISANLNLVRNKLTEKLEFESTIYALYSPKLIINYHPFHVDGSGDGYLGSIKTNDWCPISINIIQETGKFIEVIDTSYQDYFRDFKEWQYYFESKSLGIPYIQQYYEDKWTVWVKLNPVAINKVERPIAVEVSFLFRSSKKQRTGSRLVLLPVANQYDTNPNISFLLQRGKQFEATPPPSWINKIEIPNEVSLKKDISTRKQQLETLASVIREKENTLAELQKYRGLLYETGLKLQELVRTTLEKLGVRIEPSTVTDEFIIEVGGNKALIEVKGNTKSIVKGDLGQLITDLGEHLKATDEDIAGILIGNAWRLEPVEARNTHDRPIFSQAVVKIAENRSICLISTTELFKAYCKTLEDPKYKEVILSEIISSKGVVKF